VDVVFYDKVHHREVKLSQLIRIKLYNNIVGSTEDQAGGKAIIDELIVTQKVISTLAYKSDDCPSYKNWDCHLNESDLIFLRLEG